MEDSITRLPKNHNMQNDKRRCFLAVTTANPISAAMVIMEKMVVMGSIIESESAKSWSIFSREGCGHSSWLR